MAGLTADYGLPKFISTDLNGWLESRISPKHREHMERLFALCGFTDNRSVLEYSKGLTLIDTLWVVPVNSGLKWNKVSLFHNSFNETIAHIAFEGGLKGIQSFTTSPEFGTDGMLAKCWIRRQDNSVALVKAGTNGFSNAGKEPLSEVFVHQVLTRLKYSHVET